MAYRKYFERPEVQKLHNRSGERWSPLIALAAFFEEQGQIEGLLEAIARAAGSLTRAIPQIAFVLLQRRFDDPLPIGKYCESHQEMFRRALSVNIQLWAAQQGRRFAPPSHHILTGVVFLSVPLA